MKTIIYFLIGIFIFGIVSVGFTNNSKTSNTIVIQSTEMNNSSVSLSNSAKIISDRLKDFSSESFDITVLSEKNQIKVELNSNWDVKTAENLISNKGEVSFYETFNQESLSKLFSGTNQLYSLTNSNATNSSRVQIGCVSIREVDKVNDYIKTLGVNNECKFAWNQHFNDTIACLYALKVNSEKGGLLKYTDIESVKYIQDKSSKSIAIEIKLKKSAKELWSKATKRNIHNAIAIVLDNNVIFAPIVNSVIDGGLCEITGNFTENEAKYIAALGNNGILPVNFMIVK